jgi:crotonobetainyl-CoA:carnitine CoA-transferase CaiB-like acyl-CoA transferase
VSRVTILSGLKVLDMSRVFAGPWCTQILADLGADVIKVDRPGVGDFTRGWGPPWLKDARGNTLSDSVYYSAANRNKKSITIDFSTSEGQELIKSLAVESDVLVENYKVGTLGRYGLGYPALSEINPRLVYCSITAYGQTGPDAHKPGYDLIFQAIGGLMSVTGHPDGTPGGGPLKVGLPVVDVLAAMYAAVAILAALLHRQKTGVGQYIDNSLLDAVVALGSSHVLGYALTGRLPQRHGNDHPNLVPYQAFKSRDGHVIVGVGNDSQWRSLCEALGQPSLGSDPRFIKMKDRVSNRSELNTKIASLIEALSMDDCIALLEQHRVPCSKVNSYADLLADPQVVHRKLLIDLANDAGQKMTTVASPLRLSAAPTVYESPPPSRGQHTNSILVDRLGLDSGTIERLRHKGVVE